MPVPKPYKRRPRIKEPMSYFEGDAAIWLVATLSVLSSASGIVEFFDPLTLRNIAFALLASAMMGILSALTWRWGLAGLSKVETVSDARPILFVLFIASLMIGAVSVPTNITGLTATSSQELMEADLKGSRREATEELAEIDASFGSVEDRLAVWAQHFHDVAERETAGTGRTGQGSCYVVCNANLEAKGLVLRQQAQIAEKRQKLSALQEELGTALLALEEDPASDDDGRSDEDIPDPDVMVHLAPIDALLGRATTFDPLASLQAAQAEATRWSADEGAHPQVVVVDRQLEELAAELEDLASSIRGELILDLMEPLDTFRRVVHYAPASPVLVILALLLDFLPWVIAFFILAVKAVRHIGDDTPETLAAEVQGQIDDIVALKTALESLNPAPRRGRRS